jgi:hypothetical protein
MPIPPSLHAISILKADYDKVKGLFDKFEKDKDHKAKAKIVKEAVMELKVHATV